jgi:hypothetical protein
LVGAPNNAPSLCSVAGLLLALALESRYEDTPPLHGDLKLHARRSSAAISSGLAIHELEQGRREGVLGGAPGTQRAATARSRAETAG